VRLAHAKVNLWLNVVGRRSDGYHLLDSLVAFVDLADTVTAHGADNLSLVIDGPCGAGLDAEPDNLVQKAARLLADRVGRPAHAAIRLTKRIPVAAGLGGGSADAAATLRELAQLWNTSLTEQELRDIARLLGADVPMCLLGHPALASGIGDQLKPVSALPPATILLVNPGVALPTRDVFSARRGAFSEASPSSTSWGTVGDLAEDISRRGNDLTDAATSLRPVIADVLAALRTDRRSRCVGMSGSGATCFALFDSLDVARNAAAMLPAGWWRHVGHFVA
jgi:4-diphosphocytidyl-2-C-methyl-D-erythritol kinase